MIDREPRKREVKQMIEVDETYDSLPGLDQQAYGEYVKKEIGRFGKRPGLVEIRANRNVLGSPQVRLTAVWQTLADRVRYAESANGKRPSLSYLNSRPT